MKSFLNIAVVIPYFGCWPEWIDLFFYSCEKNCMIDFIFYTDCPAPKRHSDNLIFYNCSFQEYRKLIGTKLPDVIFPEVPYKLTDLKPFLGYIHHDVLQEYRYWGFCDLDLVFGDLSLLVNDIRLKQYDVITSHSYHIAGHFTICKNTPHYRNLCFQITKWNEKLSSIEHLSLDEGEWSDLVYPRLKYWRCLYHRLFKYFRIPFHRFLETCNIVFDNKLYFRECYTSPLPKDGEHWEYNPQMGKVSDPKGKQLPYLHFLFFKKTRWYDSSCYWEGDYWQINEPVYNYSCIVLDRRGVRGNKYSYDT